MREVGIRFFEEGERRSRESGESLGLGLHLGGDGAWRVDEVDEGSAAARRGLLVGDLVVGVNHWPLPEHCDLPHTIASAGRPFLLNVIVDGARRSVARRPVPATTTRGEKARSEVVIIDILRRQNNVNGLLFERTASELQEEMERREKKKKSVVIKDQFDDGVLDEVVAPQASPPPREEEEEEEAEEEVPRRKTVLL